MSTKISAREMSIEYLVIIIVVTTTMTVLLLIPVKAINSWGMEVNNKIVYSNSELLYVDSIINVQTSANVTTNFNKQNDGNHDFTNVQNNRQGGGGNNSSSNSINIQSRQGGGDCNNNNSFQMNITSDDIKIYTKQDGTTRIIGGPDNDNIAATSGNDEITGGSGADHIICREGTDIVTDYNPKEGDSIGEDCEIINPKKNG